MLIPILIAIESIPSAWELGTILGRETALARLAPEVANAVRPFGARLGSPIVGTESLGFSFEVEPGSAPAQLEELVREATESAAERMLIEREAGRRSLEPVQDGETRLLNGIVRRLGLAGVVIRAHARGASRFVYSPDDPLGQPLDLGATLRGAVIALNRKVDPSWPFRWSTATERRGIEST